MSVPPELIGELEVDALRHRFEALIAETWHAVSLIDSGILGRFYVAEAVRSIA